LRTISTIVVQGTVKMIKEMEGVTEIDKEKILGGNAMRLFGMQ
jgi:hypothetical protein